MGANLGHADVQRVVASFAESNVINLDLPVRSLLESARTGLPSDDNRLNLHILCCNEYFLVTGVVANPLDEVSVEAAQVRGSLE